MGITAGLGLGTPLRNAGAPTNSTTEVQRLTGAATGGTFKLSFGGFTTGALAYNASAAAIQTALRALSSIGSTGVTCAGGPLGTAVVNITFAGPLAGMNVAAITVDNTLATGGVVTQSTPTPGITGTARGCAVGALLNDTTNAKLYQNTGTALVPAWTVVGAES